MVRLRPAFCVFIVSFPDVSSKNDWCNHFSFIGTMIFFLFLRRVKLRSSLIVPIIGLMLGAVISAVSTFMGLLFK